MKNTKRHATTAPAARRASAIAATTTTSTTATTKAVPPPTSSSARRTRDATAATAKSKAPVLATATRCRRNTTTASTTRPQPARRVPATPNTSAPKRTRSDHRAKPPASLVHDAVRRAFHAACAGNASTTEDVAECERLRNELVRVMADHQRQADEIVALRALARSLKEEVEAMQDTIEDQHAATLAAETRRTTRRESADVYLPTVHHEFFQLDAHVDALRDENAQLRERVDIVEREKRELEDVLDREIPRCELLAVQARAELASTASQLHDEQQENDRLRSEIAYYKARSRSPVRTAQRVSKRTIPPSAADPDDEQENDSARLNVHAAQRSSHRPGQLDESLGESLLSSVASLSMSAASAFSSQLHDDVETLKSELRRLHRSIDVSVMSARSGSSRPRPSERQRQSAREEKTEDDDAIH